MHLTQDIHPHKKVLSVFGLVMINVIAVDSLRNLPISAEYGLSLVFYYFLAAALFFVPISLITAELATGWPRIGGLYVWVREAFGLRTGLFVIGLQWIYNVVWFPTILSFIAATIAHLIDPALAASKIYMLSAVLITFWIATLLNCFGMKLSSLISTLCAILGTLVPMSAIIVLAAIWLIQGHPSATPLATTNFWPDLTSWQNLAFFVGILFGLLGIEMSAIHAEDVQNPKRDYPRALLYSGLIIFFSLMLSSLAIAIVIPQKQINIVSGLMDAFQVFFNAFHLPWLNHVMAACIIIGSLGGVSAWIIGPTKGLLAATEDGSLPRLLRYTSDRGAPIALLIMQGIIFTILCSIFLLLPNVKSSYWFLSALTAQLAMLVYLILFAAAIRLRYNRPNIHRAFRIPGGNWAIWLVSGLGIVACIFAILIGFLPPVEIGVANPRHYAELLALGIILLSAIPLGLYQIKSESL